MDSILHVFRRPDFHTFRRKGLQTLFNRLPGGGHRAHAPGLSFNRPSFGSFAPGVCTGRVHRWVFKR